MSAAVDPAEAAAGLSGATAAGSARQHGDTRDEPNLHPLAGQAEVASHRFVLVTPQFWAAFSRIRISGSRWAIHSWASAMRRSTSPRLGLGAKGLALVDRGGWLQRGCRSEPAAADAFPTWEFAAGFWLGQSG